MRAVVDAMSALSPCASLGFLTRGVVRERVGSGRSMVKPLADVAVRGLTGTADAEDKAVETEAGSAEDEAGVFTAPEALSSRTIASTISFNLASSIIYLLRKKDGSPALSVRTPFFMRPKSTIHFSNSGAGRKLKS